jgi:hypothetical protein
LGCADRKIGDAQKLIQATLNDPDSARFADVAVSKTDPQVVCGMVDSKDKFVGYTGPRRFYADLSTNETQIDPEPAFTSGPHDIFGGLGIVDSVEFEKLYEQNC